MDQIKIGKFILNCRKEKGLTQEQLAEKLGVTSKSISRWENGNTMPDYSLLKDLCNELDINVNELLSGEKIKGNDYMNKSEENLIKLRKQIDKRKKILKIISYIISAIIIIAFVLNMIFFYLSNLNNSRTIETIKRIIPLYKNVYLIIFQCLSSGNIRFSTMFKINATIMIPINT